jgi:hypothetical protein
MSPPTEPYGTASLPPPRRNLHVLAIRLGIFGLFVVALGIATAGFALFGCACGDPQTSSKRLDIEGMIVNPPDPPLRSTSK